MPRPFRQPSEEQIPKSHGGAAFPRPDWLSPAGMSLRDYFAAAALPAVVRARVALANASLGNDLNQESIAEECYELADALLEVRQKDADA